MSNKLASRYGLEDRGGLEVIDLAAIENPFKGTFEEIYNMVKNRQLIRTSNRGISVTMTDDIIEDNKLSYAFERTYSYRCGLLMCYVDLAEMLVGSGMIPQEIKEDGSNTLVRVLDNKWLNLNGNEVEVEKEDLTEEVRSDLTEDTIIHIPAEVAENKIKNYIRKTYGRCLARGYQLEYTRTADGDYIVENIEWGRKLTDAEREAITY